MERDLLKRGLKHSSRAAMLLAGVAGYSSGTYAQTYDPYQILGSFNAIVSGNLSVKTDINGAVIANTLTSTENTTQEIYTVNTTPPAASTITLTDYSTNPTGSQTYADTTIGTIGSGVASVVTSVGNINYVTKPGGTTVTANTGSVSTIGSLNLTPFTTALNGLQTALGNLTANATTSYSSGTFTFNLSGGSSATDVFNITGTDFTNLEAATAIKFVGSAGQVVINIVGGNFATNGTLNFNQSDLTSSGLTTADVIWNFEQPSGSTVDFNNNGYWEGAILAGNSTVTSAIGVDLEGSVYAQNLYIGQELHSGGGSFLYHPPTNPTPPPSPPSPPTVPEPGTMTLLASGVAGLAALRRRRQKAR